LNAKDIIFAALRILIGLLYAGTGLSKAISFEQFLTDIWTYQIVSPSIVSVSAVIIVILVCSIF